MEKEIKKFRGTIVSTIMPMFITCISGGLILFLLLLYKEGFAYNTKMVEAMFILFSVSFPFCWIIMIFYTCFIYKVTIFDDGISSHNPFDRRCYFMSWEDMNSVIIKNILGYKYYLVQSEDLTKNLFVPLKLKHKDEFVRMVINLADDRNIFALKLLNI